MKALNYIRVVLIEPTHPGNIGASARAMANMGIKQMTLVNPRQFPSPVAHARAAGADRILNEARVVSDLDQAIADCTLVIGTTARPRSIEWPCLTPADAMQKVICEVTCSPVAICFGREDRGMTNREIERCHYLVRIPAETGFASLNLGSAVMVLLYELRHTLVVTDVTPSFELSEPKANAREMRQFYAHLATVLEQIEFIDGRSGKLLRKLTRLFNRANPHQQEIRMLRGILTAIEQKAGSGK